MAVNAYCSRPRSARAQQRRYALSVGLVEKALALASAWRFNFTVIGA